MKNNLNIAFCVSENYVQYICVTMQSILKHNKNVVFHILIDKISSETNDILKINFPEVYNNGQIIIHEVDDAVLSKLKFGRWTKYAWYRALLPTILPDVDKVLYLDADTVVNDSLEELFNTDLTNKSLAGVPDCDYYKDYVYERSLTDKDKGYVNSGVLLMNLDYWRRNDISNKIFEWTKENADIITCPDQDGINHVCQDSKVLLPLKYNITYIHLYVFDDFYKNKYDEIKEAIDNPCIVHYIEKLPYIIESDHIFNKIWRKNNSELKKSIKYHYFTKFPNVFSKLKTIVWDFFYDRTKNNKLKVSELLSKYKPN